MISSVFIVIVAPALVSEESTVWSKEYVAPTQAVIEGSAVTSGSKFLFSKDGAAITGSLDSDWYQRVESLYGLVLPLDTFPALRGIDGGGKASLDLGGGRDTVTETLTGLQDGTVVRISVEVFTGGGAAAASFYEKTTTGDGGWTDAPHWSVPGLARVSGGSNVKTLVALVGRVCYEVTFAQDDEGEVDRMLMTAVAYSVAFRAAHNDAYTGVDQVQRETVMLQNGEQSPAKRVNGTLYVSVSDLVANGIACESRMNARDKFCVITLRSGDVKVGQFAWKANTRGGADIDMPAPAIPYDEDLWVPASLVS